MNTDAAYGQHLALMIENVTSDKALADPAAIRAFLASIVHRLHFRILAGPLLCEEDGGPHKQGLSGIVLLQESHASIHTYPRLRAAFLDVFACRSFDVSVVFEVIEAHFGGYAVAECQVLTRGTIWPSITSRALRQELRP